MLAGDSNVTGEVRYEGFCIDMLESISKMAGFQYVIRPNPNRVYGIKNEKTGEWNGIVKELMEHVSLLA